MIHKSVNILALPNNDLNCKLTIICILHPTSIYYSPDLPKPHFPSVYLAQGLHHEDLYANWDVQKCTGASRKFSVKAIIIERIIILSDQPHSLNDVHVHSARVFPSSYPPPTSHTSP